MQQLGLQQGNGAATSDVPAPSPESPRKPK
jgi:hypothetical protein